MIQGAIDAHICGLIDAQSVGRRAHGDQCLSSPLSRLGRLIWICSKGTGSEDRGRISYRRKDSVIKRSGSKGPSLPQEMQDYMIIIVPASARTEKENFLLFILRLTCYPTTYSGTWAGLQQEYQI